MKKGESKIEKPLILLALERYPVISTNKMATELGVHYKTAERYLRMLKDDGTVEKLEFQRKKYKTHLWRVRNEKAVQKANR